MAKSTLKIDPSKILNTPEQDAILDHEYADGECVEIKAFAGTGKTTTLQLLANIFYVQSPEKKILYLAYNKSIQEEAKKKFGPNVECRTTHSMAWKDFGARFRHKTKNVRLTDVVNLLNYYDSSKWEQARVVLHTVNKFCQSADKTIEKNHIARGGGQFETNVILKDATFLWKCMSNPDNLDIPITHDGYLKLYQLSTPDIGKLYDIIFFDEAQDANDVTLDLVNSQTGTTRIFVGDDHQQIYQWRGSTNAFDKIKSDHTYYLTNSFRFGKVIAEVATRLLKHYKNEKNVLIGKGLEDRICNQFSYEDTYCIITRSNSKLFERCLREIDVHKNKISIVGGLSKGIDFQTIMDVFNIWTNNPYQIKDPFFKRFSSWSDYCTYAKGSEEGDLLRMMYLIEKHVHAIPALIEKIKDNHVVANKADVILTTCHKAKGLEWDCVELEDDFVDILESERKNEFIPKEEINLLYVGITRARLKLKEEKNIHFLMKSAEERKQLILHGGEEEH